MTKSAQYWKPSIAVFLAAALVPGLACKRGPLPEAKPPVPPITGMQLGPGLPGSAPLQALRAYADSLKFNTEPGLGDAQRVDFAKDSVGSTGDTVRIQPVTGAYLFDTTTELAQGRVVARIWSKQEYRRAGFGSWWTYWWIDRNGPGGTWRSLFISPATTTAEGMWLGWYPPGRQCPVGRTCAAIHNGSNIIICYNCGGTWCATKPTLATSP